MIRTLCIALLCPLIAQAQTCELTLTIEIGADHGALPAQTQLFAEINYTAKRAMRMGRESTAYLTDGTVKITGPSGTGLTGRLGVIHVVRAPHWADYLSFDVTKVSGDLGGVRNYEDPMLFTFYAERGQITSFDLPVTPAAFRQFARRQTFQVHTPDTMWTLPGVILGPDLHCETP